MKLLASPTRTALAWGGHHKAHRRYACRATGFGFMRMRAHASDKFGEIAGLCLVNSMDFKLERC
jgi:hypothetical protein